MNSYQTLQTRIVAACQQSEDIRAVILVGSRARKDRPLDEHADLDLILFTTKLDAVQIMPDWIESLACIWVPDFSHTGPGDPEWMVVYEDGYKVDYTFHKIEPDQSLQALLKLIPYQAVLLRGFEVLLDKTSSNGRVTWMHDEKDKLAYPAEAVFKIAVDNFLLEATRAARFIDRADMWRAKVACDTDLKHRLLTMIEWHALSKNGIAHDTWYDGRYLSEWADPQVVSALPDTFAAYETADLHRAFQATLTLYDKLAAETAGLLNFSYPTAGQKTALNWLQNS